MDEEIITPTPREAVAAHREEMLAGIKRPKYKLIPANELRFSEMNPLEGVQQRWVNHYTQHWCDALADPLRVLERKEHVFEVIDGRHRVIAIRERDDKYYRFACLVHTGLSKEQEAALFAYFNIERRTVPEIEKFQVAVLHGDPIASRIDRVLKETGHKVGCYGTLRNIVERAADLDEGEMAIRFALRTLAEAYPTEPEKRFHSILVKGTGQFFTKYNSHPNFQVEDIVERIGRGRLSAAQLRAHAQVMGSANEGAAGAVTRWLVQRHDAGKRTTKLEADRS